MTEKEKSEEIISFIANAKKQTPCELITDENISNTYSCKVIGKDLKFIYGDVEEREDGRGDFGSTCIYGWSHCQWE